jgi:hypothetical protein
MYIYNKNGGNIFGGKGVYRCKKDTPVATLQHNAVINS